MCPFREGVDSMTVTVLVQQSDGQFSASLVGSSTLQVVRPSRGEAIAALERELAAKVATGELVDLEVRPIGHRKRLISSRVVTLCSLRTRVARPGEWRRCNR